jgi:hypothetical protein
LFVKIRNCPKLDGVLEIFSEREERKREKERERKKKKKKKIESAKRKSFIVKNEGKK